MIDTQSDPGSYASILPYCTQIDVREHDAWLAGLPARLAARKATRLIANPHKRGHVTRALNRGKA